MPRQQDGVSKKKRGFTMEEKEKKEFKTTLAQRQSKARYKSRFVELRIRTTPEFKDKLKHMAELEGKSLNQFILELIDNSF